MQAVEEARQNLMRAKSVLEANKDAEANIKKSAQVNVGKAETAYFEALKKVELPATKIEVWNEVTNTAEQVIFTKEEKEHHRYICLQHGSKQGKHRMWQELDNQ